MATQPSSTIPRRDFCKSSAVLGAAALATRGARLHGARPGREQPNILFINLDQHSAEAMGHLGCAHVNTPNMDRLAQRGVSFTKSYSTDPVCCPARSSWFSGRYTPETGVVSNGRPMVADMPDLGQWLRQGGYKAVYAGKWHIPGRNVEKSFGTICPHPKNTAETGDVVTTRAAEGFLRNYSGDKPFFLSVGLLNPHDICSFVLTHTMYGGEMPFPEIDDLPPLPPNFEVAMKEPEAILKKREKLHKDSGEESGMEKWSDALYRYYIWSYYRYIEKVDGLVGVVLDALDASRFKDNTVVILTSDHGDGHIRHKMVFKSFLYDEAVRVPFIMSWPGHIRENVIDRTHLVSGVDVFPTVCDYAGIDPAPDMRGYSLRLVAEGAAGNWRDFLVAYTQNGGRMIRTERHKLITYKDDPVTQLFDMQADPWETRNLAETPTSAPLVKTLLKQLDGYESTFTKAKIDWAAGKTKKQQTSENTEWLKRTLQKNPKRDQNGDGILTLEEFRNTKPPGAARK